MNTNSSLQWTSSRWRQGLCLLLLLTPLLSPASVSADENERENSIRSKPSPMEKFVSFQRRLGKKVKRALGVNPEQAPTAGNASEMADTEEPVVPRTEPPAGVAGAGPAGHSEVISPSEFAELLRGDRDGHAGQQPLRQTRQPGPTRQSAPVRQPGPVQPAEYRAQAPPAAAPRSQMVGPTAQTLSAAASSYDGMAVDPRAYSSQFNSQPAYRGPQQPGYGPSGGHSIPQTMQPRLSATSVNEGQRNAVPYSQGAQLGMSPVTATEHALRLTEENAVLKTKLSKLQSDSERLQRRLLETQNLLQKATAAVETAREEIEGLEASNENLNQKLIEAQQLQKRYLRERDRMLDSIRNELDDVLMREIATAGK
jgi:hypothetical protein